MNVTPVLTGALLGLALGGAYFALLFRSLRFVDAPELGRFLTLLFLRGTLALAGFWGLAQLGALALLAGLAGFLLARYLIRRLLVEAP